MKVYEICERDVATAHLDEPLLAAARRMREEHTGDLVVVEERDGSAVPVAVLTDRDIVVGVLAKDGSHLDTLDVGDVVRRDLVTATEDEDVGDVLRRMRSFGVRRVPVVGDGGVLVGVLSLDDVFAGIVEELADAASLAAQQRLRERERRPLAPVSARCGR